MAIFRQRTPNGSVECKGVWKNRDFWPISRFISDMIKIWPMRIGNRTKIFEWYHFQWPWTTSNPDFKVTPLFDAEHLRNGKIYRHSYSGIYTRPIVFKGSFRMTLSDLEWLSEIFSDTKHRAVSLRQLIFFVFISNEYNRIFIITTEKRTFW